MAQRVTQFAKRSAPKAGPETEALRPANRSTEPRAQDQATRPNDLSRGAAKRAIPQDPIPLDLAPLAAPYKKYGRVSLRVERAPNRARLSKGRNNGDRSWSLALEDLQDLEYYPPDGMEDAHTLAVRVVNLDGGEGTTLAVIEIPIPARKPVAEQEDGEAEIPSISAASGGASSTELRRLRAELAKVTASLAAREIELEETRQKTEEEWTELSSRAIQNELTVARAAWKAELDQRVAAAVAQTTANLEKGRAAWLADQKAQIQQTEGAIKAGIAQSSEQQQRELEKALTDAQKAWKAEEAARLAAAEARWREQSAKLLLEAKQRIERADAALAQARADAETSRTQTESEAIRGLRGELVGAKAALTARENELDRMRAAHEEAARQWKRETELAQTRDHDAKLTHLREELASVQTALVAREAELTRTNAAHEKAREQLRKEMESALSAAESNRKTAEADRLAAAQARWREQSAKEIEELTLRSEQAEATLQGRFRDEAAQARGAQSEARLLREDLDRSKAENARREAEWSQERTDLQTALDQHRSDLAQIRSATENLRLVQESEKARSLTTETDLRVSYEGELAKLRSTLEAQQNQHAQQVEKQRIEAAASLTDRESELKSKAEAQRIQLEQQIAKLGTEAAASLTDRENALKSEAEAQRVQLEQQIAKLNAEGAEALAGRENELNQLRSAAERIQERAERAKEAALIKAKVTWKAEEADRLAHAKSRWQTQADKTLAKVTSRLQYIEKALAEERAKANAAQEPPAVTAVTPVLAENHAQMEQARVATEQARVLFEAESLYASRTTPDGEPMDGGPRASVESRIANKRIIVRYATAAILLFALLGGGFFLLPAILRASAHHPAADIAAPAASASQPQAAQSFAVVLHAAKLHSDPSSTSRTVATAPRNSQVSLIGRHNNWILVEADFRGEKRKGWVFNTFLKALPPDNAPQVRP